MWFLGQIYDGVRRHTVAHISAMMLIEVKTTSYVGVVIITVTASVHHFAAEKDNCFHSMCLQSLERSQAHFLFLSDGHLLFERVYTKGFRGWRKTKFFSKVSL